MEFNLNFPISGSVNTVEPIDDLLTRTLENNLYALEGLRSDLERANMKDIEDVRHYGNVVAGALFAGCEGTVSYFTLLDLIDTYKKGLAARYLAA